MRKVYVNVDECIPGMQTAEIIYNDYGAVIVSEDAVLDDHIIKKIKNLGINRLRIHDITEEMITSSGTEIFRAQYYENVQSVKSILHDISIGKELDIERINEVSDSIIRRINENRDIISSINDLRLADDYTYAHSINVSLLCMLIGKWMKFDYSKIKALTYAGFLHDIGKAKIPIEIINKPGQLTKNEFELIKNHTIYGYKLAESIPDINEDILCGILMHHERIDGTGYPFGLKNNQINEYARIIAVADVYDAMTSNRVYRGKENPFEVFELMENNSFGTLDNTVVNTFLKNIASYFIGDSIKLSTGDIGEIIHINPRHLSKPIVKVDEIYVDLSVEPNIRIQELI